MVSQLRCNSTQVSRALRDAGHAPAGRAAGGGPAVRDTPGFLVYQDCATVVVEYHWGRVRASLAEHRKALETLADCLERAGYIAEPTDLGTLRVSKVSLSSRQAYRARDMRKPQFWFLA